METILITGLDGSGKSTILNELSKIKDSSNFDIIFLPRIDLDSLENESILKKTASFVNQLNEFADMQQKPGLKSIAIFCSMLLFKEIYRFKSNSGVNTIFCERHPLIDIMVYSLFYAEKTSSAFQNLDELSEIDKKYPDEIEFLVQLIPTSWISERKASLAWVSVSIFKQMHIEKKHSIPDLEELFEVGLPDKIYYLKASTEILFQRIANREIHEAHENVEVLNMLAHGYDNLFRKLNQNFPGLVEIIDAESISMLDALRDSFIKKYKRFTQ